MLDTDIADVSRRHIAGTLVAGQNESIHVVTGTLVANAIVPPISNWAANVVGRERF